MSPDMPAARVAQQLATATGWALRAPSGGAPGLSAAEAALALRPSKLLIAPPKSTK